MKSNKNRFTLKDRLRYWFDNRMAKGSLGFIHVLIAGSIALAVFMAVIIILFGFYDGEPGGVLWDSIATVLNAWMPYSDEGSPGYIALMSITAIAGVLFTSVLIGIITSAIEEKIEELKRGNSIVLEEGHIVVLGFRSGEYTLLRQLVLAADNEPACIVVADDTEREELEQEIAENMDIPSNVRIVCRTVNITDPASLETCSIETCKSVIVSPDSDVKTIKSILAVLTLLRRKEVTGVRINAVISDNQYKLPAAIEKEHNITVLPTNNILGRMIAHSCTQKGLSQTFREVFNFEGAEFHFITIPETVGLSFKEVTERMDNAVPVGLVHDGEILLNPGEEMIVGGGDRVILFVEDDIQAILLDRKNQPYDAAGEKHALLPDKDSQFADVTTDLENNEADPSLESVVVIGYNENLPLIIKEFPGNVNKIILVVQDLTEEEKKLVHKAAAKRTIEVSYFDGDVHSEEMMTRIAREAKHIVLLSDHRKEDDEADINTIFQLMNLWEIRKKLDLRYNITAELRKESNEELAGVSPNVDYLVSTNISALILAQLSENPGLKEVFQEILSNRGNEIYLKSAAQMKLTGDYPVGTLRQIFLKKGCVLLGVTDTRSKSRFLMNVKDKVFVTDKDRYIVISNE